jgi:catechol 2,3-dioxygenase-like lactoylglutathione lyase family enzyme
MKPKKIWANFAVDDLERTTKFYTALGFKFPGRASVQCVPYVRPVALPVSAGICSIQ